MRPISCKILVHWLKFKPSGCRIWSFLMGPEMEETEDKISLACFKAN